MATTTIVSHTYKLKRGKEDAILNANPLLLAGEPIVVFRNDGSTNVKIGDGVTYYRDLPWIGSDQIYCAKKRSSFPNVGKSNVIYKAEETATLYQWNSTKLCYEPLGGSGTSGPINAEDVIGLTEFVDARIEAKVDNQVNEAVDTKVETVVETLKTEFVTTETVTTIQQDVVVLQEAIDTKADVEAVTEVQTSIADVQNNVTVLQQTVENKADVTAVTELEKVVETKLDTEALEAAKAEIAQQNATYTDEKISEVAAVLDTKADDSEVDSLAATVEDLQSQVDNLGDGVVESVETVTGGTAEDLLASLGA